MSQLSPFINFEGIPNQHIFIELFIRKLQLLSVVKTESIVVDENVYNYYCLHTLLLSFVHFFLFYFAYKQLIIDQKENVHNA